jgi:hypothetical protein
MLVVKGDEWEVFKMAASFQHWFSTSFKRERINNHKQIWLTLFYSVASQFTTLDNLHA